MENQLLMNGLDRLLKLRRLRLDVSPAGLWLIVFSTGGSRHRLESVAPRAGLIIPWSSGKVGQRVRAMAPNSKREGLKIGLLVL